MLIKTLQKQPYSERPLGDAYVTDVTIFTDYLRIASAGQLIPRQRSKAPLDEIEQSEIPTGLTEPDDD
jgi:hypothetical protein